MATAEVGSGSHLHPGPQDPTASSTENRIHPHYFARLDAGTSSGSVRLPDLRGKQAFDSLQHQQRTERIELGDLGARAGTGAGAGADVAADVKRVAVA